MDGGMLRERFGKKDGVTEGEKEGARGRDLLQGVRW